MQMFPNATGYKNRSTAVKTVEAAIAKFNAGCKRERPVRYMIVSNENGGYTPVVVMDSPDHIWFIHYKGNKIAVVQ
jgi:hypothetical protein